jgi:hypothetical protein
MTRFLLPHFLTYIASPAPTYSHPDGDRLAEDTRFWATNIHLFWILSFGDACESEGFKTFVDLESKFWEVEEGESMHRHAGVITVRKRRCWLASIICILTYSVWLKDMLSWVFTRGKTSLYIKFTQNMIQSQPS